MKREVAEKWVEALRSGQFKQGKGALKIPGGFCCLGVLCEISGIGNFATTSDDPCGRFVFEVPGGDSALNYLPQDVRDWAGMKARSPAFPATVPGTPPANLAKMNDDGATFEELATLIDANWEHL